MLSAELATRVFPAFFFSMIALFYTARILLLDRRIGGHSVAFGEVGSEAFRISLAFRIARVVILAAMVARAIWPEVDAWLGAVPWLMRTPVMLVGDALMLAAFLGILSHHAWMGSHWRSGIHDAGGSAELWTTGPYRHLRHPMFSLVMLGQLGLLLAVPSLFTAACFVLGVRALVGQARLEEKDSARRFGAAFRRWAARTPAWPWSRLFARGRRVYGTVVGV